MVDQLILLLAQDTQWGSPLGSEATADGQLWVKLGGDVLRQLCPPGLT